MVWGLGCLVSGVRDGWGRVVWSGLPGLPGCASVVWLGHMMIYWVSPGRLPWGWAAQSLEAVRAGVFVRSDSKGRELALCPIFRMVWLLPDRYHTVA